MSDYAGSYGDGDGIGYTPYVINPYNQDGYPLMEPFDPQAPPDPIYILEDLIATIQSWDLGNPPEQTLLSKLESAVSLLMIGNVNGAVHTLVKFQNVVNAQEDKTVTTEQAQLLLLESQQVIDLISV